MSSHFIPRFGYVCAMPPAHHQRLAYVAFTHGGVDYPQNWLDTATPATFAALGAIPRPTVNPATEQVLQTPTGWVVAPAAPPEEEETTWP